MEYVRGDHLTESCDKNKLSTRERLELFIQVCEGVQHAHQKAIIHRDIKPSNVLVAVEGDVPAPKIIDFGIAKATNQRLTEKTLFTEIGHHIGTPAYMSPEQAEMSGVDLDTRTDVYSLGVALYELLTCTLPFDLNEMRKLGWSEIQREIREREPMKPSTRVSNLGETASRAESLLRRALEIYRGALGERHPWVALALMNVAGLEEARGAVAEAVVMYQDALGILGETLDDTHPWLADCRIKLGAALRDSGRHAEAESLQRKALADDRERLGREHATVANDLYQLALTVASAGRPGEAEPLLREAIRILTDTLPSGHWRVDRAQGARGLVLGMLGEKAEAERLLDDSLTGLAGSLGDEAPETQAALRRLIDFYSRSTGRGLLRIRIEPSRTGSACAPGRVGSEGSRSPSGRLPRSAGEGSRLEIRTSFRYVEFAWTYRTSTPSASSSTLTTIAANPGSTADRCASWFGPWFSSSP